MRPLLAIFILLAAPPVAAGADLRPPHLVRVWQSEDGLPGNVVRSVAQCDAGFLWVATAEGLARFDGIEFRPVEPEASLKRSRFSFSQLFVTPGGGVWAATFQGGLFRIEHGRFHMVVPDVATPRPPRVTALARGPRGRVWFLRGETVWRIGESGGLLEVGALPDALPEEIRSGFDSGNRVRRDRAAEVQPAFIDHHGNRWRLDGAGHLAAVADDGTARFIELPQAGRLHSVNELLEDREGNIWAASGLQGLVRIRRAKVTVLDQDEGFREPAVQALLQDRGGVWWAAPRGGGLDRWTAESGAEHFEIGGPDYRPVAALFEDRGGTLWVAARDGSIFVEEERTFEPRFQREPIVSKVRAMCQPEGGPLWFGGASGLASWSGDRIAFHKFPAGEPVPDVSALASLGDRVIAGTVNGGVFAAGGERGFELLGAEETFGYRWVSGLLPVSDREIWATTLGAGLFVWDGERWRGLGLESGLPDPRLTCVLRDDDDHLWFGSLGGIIRASRTELLARTKNPAAPVNWLRLDRSDGLPTRECIGGAQPAGWRGNDGSLWFPTGRGIVRVDPADLDLVEEPPPVFIEAASTGGDPMVPADRMVEAGPGRERLEFHFVGLSYAAPEKVSYRARLVGLDDTWRDLGPQRMAAYEAVPPGDYIFEVVATHGDGITSAAPARLPVTIAPHFWQTGWFIFLTAAGVLAAAATGGWGVARSRMKRRIQELKVRNARESERSRIARDLHDDLGASLTELSILAALAAEDAGESEAQPALDSLSAKAKGVVGTLDEIVWAVNPREDTVRSLVEYVTAFAREFLGLAGISLRAEVPREIPAMPLPAARRHGVFLAARESLNNIVKHARATEVRLAIQTRTDLLEIRIQDNGRGFDPAEDPAGHGLGNLRQRMQEAGGDCRISSEPGGGTTIHLSLPLAPATTA